jgi:hypothetical protein
MVAPEEEVLVVAFLIRMLNVKCPTHNAEEVTVEN